MKVVLDTNVLIAALIARGVCAELLEHCVAHHEIISSEYILGEMQRHLTGKFKYSADEAREAGDLLRSQATLVTPAPLDQPVCGAGHGNCRPRGLHSHRRQRLACRTEPSRR